MAKTFHGSCICGTVKFEAEADLTQATGKCNCTVCGKLRYWGKQVKPADFRFTSDPSVHLFPLDGPIESSLLSEYTLNAPAIHNVFCKKCGTHVFHTGNIPQLGGDWVSVNVACIDDIDPSELAGVAVKYSDGKNNNWWNEPKDSEKAIL